MTAKGKITASNLTAGDRIIVKTNSFVYDFNGDKVAGIHESRTKTGENVTVARVIGKTFRGAQGRYERRGKYVIETTEGTFEADGIQTMWLAPEDAAGVKRAHVEAEAEDAKYVAPVAVETDDDEYDEDTIQHIEAAIDGASTVALNHIAKAIGDAWSTGSLSTKTFDRLNRRHANRIAAVKEPRRGDWIRPVGDGPGMACYEVTNVGAFTISYAGLGNDAAAGAFDRPEWRFRFVRVASDEFQARTAKCENGWHETAPARMRMLCPDCPI